jgi:hypothetical protein
MGNDGKSGELSRGVNAHIDEPPTFLGCNGQAESSRVQTGPMTSKREKVYVMTLLQPSSISSNSCNDLVVCYA